MDGFGKIKLEGQDVYPAVVDGPADVFSSPKFTFVKSRWMGDEEVSSCILCSNKFNQIRRKHHCRQCGRVFCNKCCKDKVPLPQLGIDEPERVCEICRPVTELITKSRSSIAKFLYESAKGLSDLCRKQSNIITFVELGGIQTIVALSRTDDQLTLREVIHGLHNLSQHQPLHKLLADTGAIKALCSILNNGPEFEEDTAIAGISALMIFCKSPELKTKALEDGAVQTILTMCTSQSDNIALLAVTTLGLIVEHPGTHNAVVENEKNALPRILSLTVSEDEKMQEVSLKTLAFLSTGSDWHKHRLVQEDFTSGRSLQRAIKSSPRNEQILCNAACLIANLATSTEDQGGLQELMVCMCDMLKSGINNVDLLCQVTRGIANFSRFRQNIDRVVAYLPEIVQFSVKSDNRVIKVHGMRTIMNLLGFLPLQTSKELMKDGASEVLQGIAKIPTLIDCVQTSLLAQAAATAKPM